MKNCNLKMTNLQKVVLEASLTSNCTELAKMNAAKSMLLQLRDTLECQVEIGKGLV